MRRERFEKKNILINDFIYLFIFEKLLINEVVISNHKGLGN